MAIARNTHYTGGLVDLDTGRVSREIFVSDAIYREELDGHPS